MLVINYNGNKPTTDYYKFSVQGNNNADIIRFLVALNQGGLVFHDEYTIYAKVQCVDDDYYDKVRLDAIEFDVSNNLLKADFILKAQQTSHKQIEVSLCCENLDEEIVWQTQIAKVAIANGINADEEVADQYPSVIQDLQRQINNLSASNKSIILELMPSSYYPYDFEYIRTSLRLNLVNFTANDVGTHIYLYNYSMGTKKKRTSFGGNPKLKRRMAFKHPANYDSESTNIQKLGYGVLANRTFKIGNVQKVWGNVPSYMIHGGFVQTEYEITQQHIEQGYIEIDIGVEYLSLMIPCCADNQNYDGNVCNFKREMATFGKTQFIAYCQVKDGVIQCQSRNMVMAFITHRAFIENVIFAGHLLTKNFNIKLLAY